MGVQAHVRYTTSNMEFGLRFYKHTLSQNNIKNIRFAGLDVCATGKTALRVLHRTSCLFQSRETDIYICHISLVVSLL
jgi:hypothetical protein